MIFLRAFQENTYLLFWELDEVKITYNTFVLFAENAFGLSNIEINKVVKEYLNQNGIPKILV